VRILIADESRSFSAVLRRWIESRPELAWVGTVATGPEAIAAAERLAPDVILLDAILPELDGFRVVRALRRLSLPPLAVIVTFQADDNARRAAFDAGADGFVAKDEFVEGMDLLLPELVDRLASRGTSRGPVSPRGTPIRRGSRSERVP
jgi:CheY-like chemotaxis protein